MDGSDEKKEVDDGTDDLEVVDIEINSEVEIEDERVVDRVEPEEIDEIFGEMKESKPKESNDIFEDLELSDEIIDDQVN